MDILLLLRYPAIHDNTKYTKEDSFPCIIQKIIRYYCFSINYKILCGEIQIRLLQFKLTHKKQKIRSLKNTETRLIKQNAKLKKHNFELRNEVDQLSDDMHKIAKIVDNM